MTIQATRRLLQARIAFIIVAFAFGTTVSPAFAARPKKSKDDSTKKSVDAAKDEKSKAADKTDADKKADVAKKDEPKKEAVAEKPATYKVAKKPFRVEVVLDGTFEAQSVSELTLRPQEWPALIVLKAVEHGAVVKQGDLVIVFDTEKIDHAVSDLRNDLQLAELSLKQSEHLLTALEKLAPLDANMNNRAQRIAQEDWKRYQEVDKPMARKFVDFRLKAAEEDLEYAKEEYRQLEKMYKADDLAEDSEKIVLRRAKNSVNRAELSFEYAKANHEQASKFLLQREEEQSVDYVQRVLIDAEHSRITLPLLMEKHRLENEKLKLSYKQTDEKLQKLLADRSAMIVKAPIDGIVYYGHCVRGKWTSSNPSGEAMRRGTQVMPNDIIMSIVQIRPMMIRATATESQLQNVHAGLTAVVDPTGFAPRKLSAVVQRVATVPLPSGGFDTQLTVDGSGLFEALMPGMTCEMRMIPYKKMDALTVPPKTVFTDEFDPAKQYVYITGKGPKPEKRTVTLGHRNDKQVEIETGLVEGDQILLEKPKDD